MTFPLFNVVIFVPHILKSAISASSASCCHYSAWVLRSHLMDYPILHLALLSPSCCPLLGEELASVFLFLDSIRHSYSSCCLVLVRHTGPSLELLVIAVTSVTAHSHMLCCPILDRSCRSPFCSALALLDQIRHYRACSHWRLI
jgi:hypothetical protein